MSEYVWYKNGKPEFKSKDIEGKRIKDFILIDGNWYGGYGYERGVLIDSMNKKSTQKYMTNLLRTTSNNPSHEALRIIHGSFVEEIWIDNIEFYKFLLDQMFNTYLLDVSILADLYSMCKDTKYVEYFNKKIDSIESDEILKKYYKKINSK